LATGQFLTSHKSNQSARDSKFNLSRQLALFDTRFNGLPEGHLWLSRLRSSKLWPNSRITFQERLLLLGPFNRSGRQLLFDTTGIGHGDIMSPRQLKCFWYWRFLVSTIHAARCVSERAEGLKVQVGGRCVSRISRRLRPRAVWRTRPGWTSQSRQQSEIPRMKHDRAGLAIATGDPRSASPKAFVREIAIGGIVVSSHF